MVEIIINVRQYSLNVRLQIWIVHEQFVHLKITNAKDSEETLVMVIKGG